MGNSGRVQDGFLQEAGQILIVFQLQRFLGEEAQAREESKEGKEEVQEGTQGQEGREGKQIPSQGPHRVVKSISHKLTY